MFKDTYIPPGDSPTLGETSERVDSNPQHKGWIILSVLKNKVTLQLEIGCGGGVSIKIQK